MPYLPLDLRTIAPITGSRGQLVGHLVFCIGCRRPHFYDRETKFNGDECSPTVEPVHKIITADGRPFCNSLIVDGRIQYLEGTAHEFAGQAFPLLPIHREVDYS